MRAVAHAIRQHRAVFSSGGQARFHQDNTGWRPSVCTLVRRVEVGTIPINSNIVSVSTRVGSSLTPCALQLESPIYAAG